MVWWLFAYVCYVHYRDICANSLEQNVFNKTPDICRTRKSGRTKRSVNFQKHTKTKKYWPTNSGVPKMFLKSLPKSILWASPKSIILMRGWGTERLSSMMFSGLKKINKTTVSQKSEIEKETDQETDKTDMRQGEVEWQPGHFYKTLRFKWGTYDAYDSQREINRRILINSLSKLSVYDSNYV